MKNIILIGMPGCGKTAIGKCVAKALNLQFCDCDHFLEATLNTTIPQIFEEHGEEYFRKAETNILKELSTKCGAVISTGGGVVERPENIEILRKTGTVVFINRPLDILFKDIDTSHRPLLKSGKDRLIELYNRRIELYKNACDIEVLNNSTLEAVTTKIVKEISKND